MNKSFSVIKSNAGSEVQDTSTSFATIIGRFINRRYFQILRTINWRNINDAYTFDTVVGTQRYVLPDDFGKEISCTDTTNSGELSKFQIDELYSTYKSITATGNIERYAISDSPVQAQPLAASTLSIGSSSANDTTQTVLIRGIVSGVETYESVTVTGTTAALTTNSYTRIKAISKSAATAGFITITSNAGVVTNALIPLGTLETRYKICILHYVPTNVITIAMPYIISPLPLSQDYDYPVIDIADLIEIGAIADCLRYKRQFSKANAYEVNFTHQLNDYIFDKENQPNEVIQFSPQGYSRDTV